MTATTHALTNQQLHAALIEAATLHRTAELEHNTCAAEVTDRRINELLEELHTRHHP